MKLAKILRKLPKWAIIWTTFSIAVYLYDKRLITISELTLLSNIALAFWVWSSAITRFYDKK